MSTEPVPSPALARRFRRWRYRARLRARLRFAEVYERLPLELRFRVDALLLERRRRSASECLRKPLIAALMARAQRELTRRRDAWKDAMRAKGILGTALSLCLLQILPTAYDGGVTGFVRSSYAGVTASERDDWYASLNWTRVRRVIRDAGLAR